MSDRGRICPIPPDEDEPLGWFLVGLFVLFFVAPGLLLLCGAALGGLFQLIFGNSFESL